MQRNRLSRLARILNSAVIGRWTWWNWGVRVRARGNASDTLKGIIDVRVRARGYRRLCQLKRPIVHMSTREAAVTTNRASYTDFRFGITRRDAHKRKEVSSVARNSSRLTVARHWHVTVLSDLMQSRRSLLWDCAIFNGIWFNVFPSFVRDSQQVSAFDGDEWWIWWWWDGRGNHKTAPLNVWLYLLGVLFSSVCDFYTFSGHDEKNNIINH